MAWTQLKTRSMAAAKQSLGETVLKIVEFQPFIHVQSSAHQADSLDKRHSPPRRAARDS